MGLHWPLILTYLLFRKHYFPNSIDTETESLEDEKKIKYSLEVTIGSTHSSWTCASLTKSQRTRIRHGLVSSIWFFVRQQTSVIPA